MTQQIRAPHQRETRAACDADHNDTDAGALHQCELRATPITMTTQPRVTPGHHHYTTTTQVLHQRKLEPCATPTTMRRTSGMMMATVAMTTVTRAVCFHNEDGRSGNDTDTDA